MSSAIAGLHLEEPPATVHRYDFSHARMWRVRCEACGTYTVPHPLISLCLFDQREHAAVHVTALRAAS